MSWAGHRALACKLKGALYPGVLGEEIWVCWEGCPQPVRLP